MKRALAIAVALCTIGALGFAQINLSGSWATKMKVLPDFALDQTVLTINYGVAGFTITSVSTIKAAGFTSQTFALKGDFGPFNVSGSMAFDPTAVVYTHGSLKTGFDFGGLALSLNVEHWTVAQYAKTFLTAPTQFCGIITVPGGILRYTLEGTVAPITVKATFVDCCTGTQFHQLLATLKGLELCCGLTYDAEFSFKKTGFDYVKFSMKNMFAICCGLSFDVAITYKTDSKAVSVTPKLAGFGEACFQVFANPIYDTTTNKWGGIEILGWAVKCTLGDCSSITYVHGFAAIRTYHTWFCLDQTKPFGWKLVFGSSATVSPCPTDPSSWYNGPLTYYGVDATIAATYGLKSWFVAKELKVTDLSVVYGTFGYEYEALKMEFCGAGCCGGKYTANIGIYWGNGYDFIYTWSGTAWGLVVNKLTTLFGLSRVDFNLSMPIMADFSFDLGFSYNLLVAASALAPALNLNPMEMTVGWTFKF